jgi:hypothetical protein
VTRWHPRLELARLLEALSEDIIATSDKEVRQMHGRAVAGTAREVKLLIKGARVDKGSGMTTGVGETGAGPRLARTPRRPSHHQRH